MAIIVEEEKKIGSIVRIVGWLAVLVILGVAIYYLFFVAPPSAAVPTPVGLSNLTSLSKVNIASGSVAQTQQFLSLQQYIPSPSAQGPAGVGRTNPFLAP